MKTQPTRFLLLIGLWAVAFPLVAQQNAADTTAASTPAPAVEEGKLYLAPLPVLAANPAFGFIYGAAASAGVYLGPPESTRMSSGMLTATYSTKNQLMFTFKPVIYTRNDEWNILGDWRLFFSSQPTYGLGTGPQSNRLATDGFEYEDGRFSQGIETAQLMDFNLIRLHQTALKKVRTNWYAGIGYHLDLYSNIGDQRLNLDTFPPVLTSHYTYSLVNGFDPEQYALSGLSMNLIHDSRDNVANPYTGRYAFASFRWNATWLGSTKGSSQLWLEYRDYLSLSGKKPRNLLAFWAYGNFTTGGTLPYMGLPALGWDQMGRSGRAYPQGRFRGENMVYAELELRWGLPVVKKNPDLLGIVAFVNATTASAQPNNIELFEYVDPAAGLGLRIMINKQARTNLTLDYAWGKYGAGAFYLNLNETF